MNKILLTLKMAALCAAQTFAAPLGPAFTYQGRLNDGGAPATGKYDMIFNLYDDPANGNVLGTYSIFGGVPVTNGVFTVELNAYGEFGTNAFNGQARWLQIGVRTNSNNAMNPWIHLNPRQPIQCAPQAMFAENAGQANMAASVADGAITASKLASGAVQAGNLAPGSLAWSNITGIPAGFADGMDDGIFYKAGKGLNLDWLFEFSVNFAGSGTANSAARSDHNHFGANWGGTTSLGLGLSVTNGAPNSVGLFGQQGSGSGFPYIFGNTAGVWGESSHGNGVFGGSAVSAGVRGMSLGTNGYGVYGSAIRTNGSNVGVVGQSDSSSGSGVVGKATSTAGINFGVRGETPSTGGRGVHGLATAKTGFADGVVGQSDSTLGVGVRGLATGGSGSTAGVRGEAYSPEGVGVVALNSSGVALKAAGTGIIQSAADSWFWFPAMTALDCMTDNSDQEYTRQPQADGSLRVYANPYVYQYRGADDIYIPLPVPAVLYGQNTRVKSVSFQYKCDKGSTNYLSSIWLRGASGLGTSVVIANDFSEHRSNVPETITLNPNLQLSATNGFFMLVLRVTIEEPWDYNKGHAPAVYIGNVRVQVGHN